MHSINVLQQRFQESTSVLEAESQNLQALEAKLASLHRIKQTRQQEMIDIQTRVKDVDDALTQELEECSRLAHTKVLMEMQYDTATSRMCFLPEFLNEKSIQATSIQDDSLDKLESVDALHNHVDLTAALEDVQARLDACTKIPSQDADVVQELEHATSELAEEQQALSLILACVDSWSKKNHALRTLLRQTDGSICSSEDLAPPPTAAIKSFLSDRISSTPVSASWGRHSLTPPLPFHAPRILAEPHLPDKEPRGERQRPQSHWNDDTELDHVRRDQPWFKSYKKRKTITTKTMVRSGHQLDASGVEQPHMSFQSAKVLMEEIEEQQEWEDNA